LLKKLEIIEIYDINQSAVLIKCYVVIHLLAILAIFLTHLFLIYKIFLLIVIVISLWYALNAELKFNKIVIRHRLETVWEICYSDGFFNAIQILPSTVLTPHMLILHFKLTNQKKKTILIVKDALGDEKYRELSVSLKILGLKKDGP